MRYRDYGESEKAMALGYLEANRGNVDRTAKQTGIPRSTILRWKEQEADPDSAQLRHQKKALFGPLADHFEEEAREALSLASEKRNEATYRELVTAAGIATDKARALRNDSAITPEQLGGLLSTIEEMILAEVREKDAQERIGEKFRKLAAEYGATLEGEASAGDVSGSLHSDEGDGD